MKFKTILAAIDDQDALASGVVQAACALAMRDDAQLVVVEAWPELQIATAEGFADPMGGAVILPLPEDIDADKKARAAREKEIKTLVATHCLNAKVHMLDGDPAEAVIDYAAQIDADVIVVGSHQKGMWQALMSGTPSRDIARRAPCAVFLVNQPFIEKMKGLQKQD